MEELAMHEFEKIQSKFQKDLKISSCGLYLSNEYPFIGASPDGVMTCNCCPKSCIEIKCPYSINYTSPADSTIPLPFMEKIDGLLKLKKSHKYFTQCLMQMGITNSKYCYFFVWTQHGHVLEKIVFDEPFWNDLKDICKDFFEMYLHSVYSSKTL